jgi:hypothetical protein
MKVMSIYIDADKDYVALFLKKWSSYVAKEELIPKIVVEFYLTECSKFTANGLKKATMLHGLVETNQLSYDVYIEHMTRKMKETFTIYKNDE